MTVTVTRRSFAGRKGYDLAFKAKGSRTLYRLWQPSLTAAVRLRTALRESSDPWDAITSIWSERPPTEAPYRHVSAAGKASWAGLTPEQRLKRVAKIQASRKRNREARALGGAKK